MLLQFRFYMPLLHIHTIWCSKLMTYNILYIHYIIYLEHSLSNHLPWSLFRFWYFFSVELKNKPFKNEGSTLWNMTSKMWPYLYSCVKSVYTSQKYVNVGTCYRQCNYSYRQLIIDNLKADKKTAQNNLFPADVWLVPLYMTENTPHFRLNWT